MKLKSIAFAVALSAGSLAISAPTLAATDTDNADFNKINSLQQQIDSLQNQVLNLKNAQEHTANQVAENKESASTASSDSNDEDGITVGGAVRFQYTNNSYDGNNQKRGGDIAMDTFRLNLDGKIGGVILSTEWRWYTYFTTLHHAWVGYDFDDKNQIQIGLTRIPFGVQPYDSHSFFFSSNYYVGLEDTYAFGTEYVHDGDHWNIQAAFFKNRQRGVGGLGGPNANYSYNLTKDGANNDVGTANTGALRVAYAFTPNDDTTISVGASGLYGALYPTAGHKIGNYGAWAGHTNINWKTWNIQLQATQYDYRFDNGSTDMMLGAYTVNYDTPTSAHTYTANVAYGIPVSWGPITNLNLYNDYSIVENKSGNAHGTYMNVTGVAVSAGGVYAYIDYINARNQPFIGGNLNGTSSNEVEHRFNFNIGYYF